MLYAKVYFYVSIASVPVVCLWRWVFPKLELWMVKCGIVGMFLHRNWSTQWWALIGVVSGVTSDHGHDGHMLRSLSMVVTKWSVVSDTPSCQEQMWTRQKLENCLQSFVSDSNSHLLLYTVLASLGLDSTVVVLLLSTMATITEKIQNILKTIAVKREDDTSKAVMENRMKLR